jgi:tetratricopeptide (TPR) repeat protein
MICEHCHVVVPDAMRFCPVCGRNVAEAEKKESRDIVEEAQFEAADPTAQPIATTNTDKNDESEPGRPDVPPGADTQENTGEVLPQVLESQHEEPVPGRKAGGKKRIGLAIGGALLLVVCAVLIPLLIRNTRQLKYNEGVTLFEQGDYAAAQARFATLGSFDDAEEMAQYCENKIAYQDAEASMRQGDYEDAKERFLALGEFEDAPEQAELCKNTLAYAEAEELEDAGSMQAAAEAFYALGDFEDAPERAEFCSNTVAYDKAEELLSQGDYEGASELFAELAADEFSNAQERYQYCIDTLAYLDAEALLNAGSYYDAYLAFESLSGFEDASNRMYECIQTFPDTGETYHNEAYSARSCSLTIEPPEQDGSWNYMKIYAENGDLVSRIAIGQGDKAKIWLPKGNYRIKAAYGYGDWFGETDLFGDDGYYYILQNGSDDNDIFTLKSNYIYTLTLRSATTNSGDSIDMETESREDF